MYTPNKKITGSKSINPVSVIDDMDIYNSKFLHLFLQLPTVGYYKITRFEERIDLISADAYDGEDHSGLLLLFNNMSIKDLKIGTVLNLFSLDDIQSLYTKLNDIQERL